MADAYADVMSILNGPALSAQQKAAITVTPTYQTPGDTSTPVVAFTVTMSGDYSTMRLGDLQRSAMRVLNIVMQSEPFGQLATEQGVHGINVGPVRATQVDVRNFVTDSLSPVTTR